MHGGHVGAAHVTVHQGVVAEEEGEVGEEEGDLRTDLDLQENHTLKGEGPITRIRGI